MKNTASIFTITLASSYTFFYFWEYPSCEKWRIFIWETCFVPKYLKTYEKTKYTFPSSWNNLVHGGRAAKISKQHKRLEKIRKNWYRLDLASQTKEREVSLRLAKMQDGALSLMLQSRNLMLPNVSYLQQ